MSNKGDFDAVDFNLEELAGTSLGELIVKHYLKGQDPNVDSHDEDFSYYYSLSVNSQIADSCFPDDYSMDNLVPPNYR